MSNAASSEEACFPDSSAAVAVVLWGTLLTAVFIVPHLLSFTAPADSYVRNTVRLALIYYGAAALLMLRLRPEEWHGRSRRGRLARLCWTLSWLTFLIHVRTAFHFFHHESHAHAVEHTRQVTGVGEGIYVSHLFSLLWTVDVAWWWLWPIRYALRPLWVGRLWHGFMVFIIFNGTVVYETGPIRWAGLCLFVGLTVVWLWPQRGRRIPPGVDPGRGLPSTARSPGANTECVVEGSPRCDD